MAAPATGTARDRKEENETDEEEGKERDKTRECVRSFAAIASKVAVRRKRKGLDVSDIVVVVVVPSNNRALFFRSLESGFMYCTRFVLPYYSRSSIGGGRIRKQRDRSPWLPQQKKGGSRILGGQERGKGCDHLSLCIERGGKGGGCTKETRGQVAKGETKEATQRRRSFHL